MRSLPGSLLQSRRTCTSRRRKPGAGGARRWALRAERLESRDMLSVSSITHTSSDHFFIDTTQGDVATCNYASFRVTNDATPDADRAHAAPAGG